MQVPVHITFRHMDVSPALEARIRQGSKSWNNIAAASPPVVSPSNRGIGASIKATCSRSASI